MINKNDLISIIVKPTNACNLRCKHCYHAGTGYDNEQMSDKMLEKLISSSVPHFSGIHYIWHGGEPLSMPLTFYKRALELEQKYKHNPNQNIKNSMQSNGTYVTEDVAKFIADNNILIGFSFEGPYNDFLRSHTNMTLKGYENLKKLIVELLTTYHKKYRLRSGVLKEEVRSKVESKFKTKEMDILLEKLQNEKVIKINENLVSIYDFEVVLNDKQKEIKDNIQKKLKLPEVLTILNIKDICENKYYEEVLEYMIGKDIEKLDDTYIMDKEIYEEIKINLIKYLEEFGEITLGQYRDMLNSSRKNCMIILENFDRNKITKRDDNKRTLYNK